MTATHTRGADNRWTTPELDQRIRMYEQHPTPTHAHRDAVTLAREVRRLRVRLHLERTAHVCTPQETP